MRADARRNRGRIIAAAKAEITENGSDVSMEQIAKAAGVAVGTLYRHYPTKTDLVTAVLTDFSEDLVRRSENAASSLVAPGDAIAGIRRLLTDFLAEAATNQAVKAAARLLDAAYITSDQVDRGQVALRALVAAGQADGDLRDGLTADDIYLLMLSAPASLDEAARCRWLELILAGIGNANLPAPATSGPVPTPRASPQSTPTS